jgi:plasmid stabilization system protein ParE
LILEIDLDALAELEHHVEWYEAQRSGWGSELLSQVREAFVRIAEQPGLGAPWPRLPSVRRIVLASFPLLLIYAVEADTVFVAAVAHTSRRPGYWIGRLARR